MGAGQVPGGATAGQARPLALTEGVVAVTAAETTIANADKTRRNLVIQNLGPDIVQIYVTTGIGFGGGGIALAPGSATTVGGIWEAAQCGVGVVQAKVYGICNGGDTASVSVTVER